jgi:hypothetical protein
MLADYSNIPMDDLVDLLSQKTQVYTQLLINKKFGQEYRDCKDTIQHIMAEIERRKETAGVHQQIKPEQPGLNL